MRSAISSASRVLGISGALAFLPLGSTQAQGLDSLMALARTASPAVLSAEAQVKAAQARVSPSTALAEPMLMAGLINLPLGSPGVRDEMTMKMLGVAQTLPYPGKRRLRGQIAAHEVEAAEAELEAVRRAAARDVGIAWFEFALSDSLARLATQQHALLLAVANAARAGYASGRAGQEEPLRAETELVRLSGEVAALQVERTRAAAHINALLGRGPEVPITPAVYPARIRRAALGDSGAGARFADSTLGAPAAGSPLPKADSLRALALALSPMIKAHLAELAAQSTRVRLAMREASPDPTLSLQYGQRSGLTDMVSATISLPIPLWRGRKQNQLAAADRAGLDALEHEHHRMVAELEAEVLDLARTAELHRTRLALYHAGVLPRAQAAAEVALGGYRTGRTSFQSVLDTYVALYEYEAEAIRLLTEFARAVLTLEALTGREIAS